MNDLLFEMLLRSVVTERQSDSGPKSEGYSRSLKVAETRNIEIPDFRGSGGVALLNGKAFVCGRTKVWSVDLGTGVAKPIADAPNECCFDVTVSPSDGSLFVSDDRGIVRILPAETGDDSGNRIAARIAGNGGKNGYRDGDGTSDALFSSVYGISIDVLGGLWCNDNQNSSIRYVAPGTKREVTTRIGESVPNGGNPAKFVQSKLNGGRGICVSPFNPSVVYFVTRDSVYQFDGKQLLKLCTGRGFMCVDVLDENTLIITGNDKLYQLNIPSKKLYTLFDVVGDGVKVDRIGHRIVVAGKANLHVLSFTSVMDDDYNNRDDGKSNDGATIKKLEQEIMELRKDVRELKSLIAVRQEAPPTKKRKQAEKDEQ